VNRLVRGDMGDVEARLAALATLDDGWLDDAGVAIAPAGLAWLTATRRRAQSYLAEPR